MITFFKQQPFPILRMSGISKTYYLMLLLLTQINLGVSQEFSRIMQVDVKSGRLGTAIWCDVNGDGYQDIFTTGQDLDDEFLFAEIQFNNLNSNFYHSNIDSLPKVIYNCFAAGDIDNDGTLDLIYAGTQSGFVDRNITKIFKNIGDSALVEIQHELPRLSRCCLNLVDIDNDGYEDLYYHGIDTSNNFTSGTWKNLHNSTFEQIENNLEGISGPRGNRTRNSSLWIDFDNDGFKDIIAAQSTWDEYQLRLYKNMGDFTFQQMELPIPDLNYVFMDAGDINQDGLMDIVIAGSTEYYLSAGDIDAPIYILLNQGNFSFIEYQKIEDMGVFQNSLKLGDINNDGYLDMLFYGAGGSFRTFKLYLNDQNAHFYELENNIASVHSGGAEFGDIDNDNDLDLLIYGDYDLEPYDQMVTYVFENKIETINEKPSPPESLMVKLIAADKAELVWDEGSDDHTISKALNYHLRVGTIDDPHAILSSYSSDSALRIYHWGNQQQNHQFTIHNLLPNHYVAGIQSIDNSYNISVTKEIEFCIKETTYYFGDTIDFCQDQEIKIDIPGNHLNYSWSNGSTDSVLITDISGFHSLNLRHNDGCISYESIYLNQLDKINMDLGDDTTIMIHQELIINPNLEPGEFVWSDSTTNRFMHFLGRDYGLGSHTITLEFLHQNGCQSYDSILINVVEPKPTEVDISIDVYPNPFFDQINIRSNKIFKEETLLKLYDTKGKLLHEIQVPKLNYLSSFKTADLAEGMYYLRIINHSQGFQETYKLVKQYRYKSPYIN